MQRARRFLFIDMDLVLMKSIDFLTLMTPSYFMELENVLSRLVNNTYHALLTKIKLTYCSGTFLPKIFLLVLKVAQKVFSLDPIFKKMHCPPTFQPNESEKLTDISCIFLKMETRHLCIYPKLFFLQL